MYANKVEAFSAPVLKKVYCIIFSSTLQQLEINLECQIKEALKFEANRFTMLSDFFTTYPQYRQAA
ncbi:MAG: hypothetical protein LBD75_00755 [Candidatus Peribacteria bacterium]|nr:hypothetical protein [Candidatus Peribacteria bacterium]